MFDLLPFGPRQRSLRNYFDFDHFEKDLFGNMPATFGQIKTDIIEEEGQFKLQAELPGFSKKDISIDLNGDYLTIKAEYKAESEEKNEETKYIRRERSYSSFRRTFNISDINVDAIEAKYNNGILELTMPKKQIALNSVKQIEIQ